MSILTRSLGRLCLSAGWGLAFLTGTAAATTPAGTEIENSFTLDYTVNGLPGTQLSYTESPLVVDRLVDFDLTLVSPPATIEAVDAPTTSVFQLVNTGNDRSTYHFEVTDETTPFDAWSLSYTLFDADSNPVVTDQPVVLSQIGADITADPSRASIDIDPGYSLELTATATVPFATPDGTTGSYILRAEALNPSAWLIDASVPVARAKTLEGGLNDPIRNVLADGSSGFAGDAVADGIFAAQQTYSVTLIHLEITYQEILVRNETVTCNDSWDPASVDPNLKMVPDHCVGYLVALSNPANAPVDNISVTIPLPPEIEFNEAVFNAASAANIPGVEAQLVASTANPSGPVLSVLTSGGAPCTWGTTGCIITVEDGALDAGHSTLIAISGRIQ